MNTKIVQQLKKLPDAPGVYLFFNSQKELIYVGKATSLRSRVKSYFRGAHTSRPIEQMIHKVADVKFKVTDSVLEAVIEEGADIKKFRPKYNVDWRDDKSWNYIIITGDTYPKVVTVREHELKNWILKIRNWKFLFGPYPGLNTEVAMKILRRLFFISTCAPHSNRPCFYRQLGQCLGVCTGEISPRLYRQKVIRPLGLFLSGKKKILLRQLNTKMVQASKNSEFEEAARLRDQIKALQRIQDVALLNKNFFNPPQKRKSNSPFRLEAYDISNLGESDKVGSMVVFDKTSPQKSSYRKFNIKNVKGQSDVDCLSEVIERRLKHSDWPLPQVILVDGGYPQVNRTVKILRQFSLAIPVVGLAKGPARKKNEIVLGERKVEFKNWVEKNLPLLIGARDEAHRFAIKFNRSKRKIK